MKEFKQLLSTISLAGINAKHPDVCLQLETLTSFLPPSAKYAQRVWHVMNDTYAIPLCPVCNKQLGWQSSAKKQPDGTYKVPNVYSEYCSYKCRVSVHKDQMMADRRAAMIVKYGVDNPMKVEAFRLKNTEAQLAADLDGALAKRHHTNVEKYGVTNAMHDTSIRQKQRQNIRHAKVKAGSLLETMTDDVVAELYQSKRMTAAAIADEFKVARATVDRVIQRLGIKQYNKNCFNLDSLAVLKDRLQLTALHYDQKLTQTDIAEKLGVDASTVSLYFRRHNIDTVLYKNPSKQEQQLADFVSEIVDQPIIRNTKSVIPPLELDIYIPSHNLAIEYCGLYWHSNAHDRITPSYHKHKMEACNKAGIRLLTIFEDEWVNKPDVVKHTLQHILNATSSQSVGARHTTVHQLSTYEKNEFFDTYHIQGSGPGSITYGLKHNNQIVAAMTFINKATNVYELNRYATSQSVPGGFSKLLSHFKQQHSDWEEIVSFADLRWSEGSMYKKNQFMLDKTLPPDYYWVVDGDRQHKFAWRHGNRLSKLPDYNSTLSESQNMLNHGYFKIHNCGLQRWVQRNGQ